ncbi:hypothetical protein BD410DRAFT_810181 [Rickenella mellea]|uniref:Uncharacterized protein n=1 Tax=Rickenella mellea TaxID=50990 RepID=A0A4Y7PEY0_9AGAM|nr:hypothetical protein BD410DRAFT_810181 [Rickenella mellea]
MTCTWREQREEENVNIRRLARASDEDEKIRDRRINICREKKRECECVESQLDDGGRGELVENSDVYPRDSALRKETCRNKGDRYLDRSGLERRMFQDDIVQADSVKQRVNTVMGSFDPGDVVERSIAMMYGTDKWWNHQFQGASPVTEGSQNVTATYTLL